MPARASVGTAASLFYRPPVLPLLLWLLPCRLPARPRLTRDWIICSAISRPSGRQNPGQPGRLAGERKLVTVLFADIAGYTALSAQVGEGRSLP